MDRRRPPQVLQAGKGHGPRPALTSAGAPGGVM
jgi:hypothetical protein